MNRQGENSYSLSMQDSMVIKGVAICFMLWHHLFSQHPEFGRFVQYTAFLGKVCVAMFLFVSAYGLTTQVEMKGNFTQVGRNSWKELLEFYFKRLLKLYANFWVVFLIFVPIGVFVFNRNLTIPYGEHVNLIKRLILDMFGMQGFLSYNITWWFYQLIIILYILFPGIYWLMKKNSILVLGVFFVLLGYHRYHLPVIHDWLFPFGLGIGYALHQKQINSFLNSFSKLTVLFVAFVLVIFIAYLRQHLHKFGGMGMDGFFTLAWVLFILLTIRNVNWLSSLFVFLGKHSMNIFMVHTFIYYYFFSGFIYSFKYPVVIFLVLALISLCISIVLEYLKVKTGIYTLVNKTDRINLKRSNLIEVNH